MKFENYSLNMIDEESIEEICKYSHNIEKVGTYFSTKIRPKEYWLDKLRKFELWTDNNGYLTINDSKNNIIGLVWHFKHNIHSSFELGINLFQDAFRGKGIGRGALMSYSEYLFDSYDINRLQYNMVEDNVASENLAIKCGFKYEGTQRKALYIRGNWHNLKLYSKLKGE